VVGHAGAGKTSALAALAEVFGREGFPAVGAAPSGVAAANLAAETGMPSATLHRLLAEARAQGRLPKRCLLVVDEAGMADTRTLTRLLLDAHDARGKVVLVGDPAQLPAVGPGGLFQAIVERKGAIELSENHRQHDELERQALALLREGRSTDYLAHVARQGRLEVADTRTEAKARLVADWWQAATNDLGGSVMIAYRRADVAELNTVARALLDQQRRLGPDRMRSQGGVELAVGERILCTRNDRRLEIANGSRGTITAIDRSQRAVIVDLDDHRRVTLPARYLDAGHVRYGYALTGHKTQGLTVERAFVLADDRRALKEWGYVALTRAREQTSLYTITERFDPDASPHRIEPDGPIERLADALTRPVAETLALDALGDGPALTDRARLTEESRLLHERRRTVEEKRRQATLRLNQARRERDTLGLLGRARRRRTLGQLLEERERDLDRLSRELKQLDAQRQKNRERMLELAPAQRRPEHGLTREPDLRQGLVRAPDRGLEL
jgi:ATP-dependent exoDNAse (exonuclease V) alpha subunit